MGLETTTLISGLNAAWPLGSDNSSEGDDHLRLLKSVLQGTFTDTSTTFTINKGASSLTFTSTGALTINGSPYSNDATLLARANHTGTQAASTISNFSTAADARVALMITNKITVASTAPTSPAVNDIWINTT